MFFIAPSPAIRLAGAMGAGRIGIRVFLLVVVVIAHSTRAVQDDIHLDLIRHQPCIWRQGTTIFLILQAANEL